MQQGQSVTWQPGHQRPSVRSLSWKARALRMSGDVSVVVMVKTNASGVVMSSVGEADWRLSNDATATRGRSRRIRLTMAVIGEGLLFFEWL